jgi:uncharacterized protein YndB with AHSA1/START domain
MNTESFVIERVYNAPQTRVWQAITDNKKMKKWYFDIDSFEARVGHRFTFSGENEGVKYVHLCEVTVVEPETKLAYTWTYQDYEGSSEVTFQLFPEGEKTRLKLTHTGLETFPKNNKDFARESFAGGWTFIIGQSLKEFVEQ